MTPNRVVAIAAAVLTLALAVLPVIADMDWTSTAGIIAGITAVAGIVLKWLDGWQKHEDRQGTKTVSSMWTAPAGSSNSTVAPDEPAPLNAEPVPPPA